MVSWKWTQDGVQVESGNPQSAEHSIETFFLVPTTLQERSAFGYELDRIDAVVKILQKSQSAFEDGIAEYRDSVRRLGDLMDELTLAMGHLREQAESIGYRFVTDLDKPVEPRALIRNFKGALEDLVRFAREWARGAGIDKKEDEK